MPAPDAVVALVERFHQHHAAHKHNSCNEEQVLTDFLNPLFKAMGWDVDNEQGYAPRFREVGVEDSIKVGAVTKSPDYSFRIGGVRKFFLEAKKPSSNIKKDVSLAYQVRRYSWSAKLLLSILSNFEEFADADNVTRHDRMVALVGRMLALHRQRQAARTPQEQTVLAAQIEAADREIDRLVYDLYGLTAEEIGVVEGE